MRPRLIVSVVPDCNSNGIDADCSKCDFNVDNCYSRTEDELSTPAERIAALTSALKELTGCDWVRKPGRESLLAKFKGRKGYHEKDKPKE